MNNASAYALDLNDEFPNTPARRGVVAIVRAFGTVQRQMATHFAQFGLTPPQFQMLTVINRLSDEQITQRRLARELYVSFPNITVMLARLEEAGLIVREPSPNDGRAKLVRLTTKGRSLLRKIWKVHQRQLEHVMSGLNKNERRQLACLLNKMIAAHAEGTAATASTTAQT
jgi:DNA-binding MarR family transcriptional regulator